MVKNIALAWKLYRMCRRLMEAQDSTDVIGPTPTAVVSMTIMVEGSRSMEERIAVAAAMGQPPPDPRTAAEVSFWPAGEVGKPGRVYRGHTLGEALGLALRGE